ncbi:putative ATPase [Rhizomicrobium palustre]|uniref:Putative ATPase n=1 Tax=Rhizomicrobium palustre TaxID=189966 RepID=A0A846N0I7_9PROT|nr:putative ATPase [Rhizomicrobium palustre]
MQSLAADGGLQSALWAGPESLSRSMKSGEHEVQGTLRKKPVSLKLGFGGDDYGYAIDLGLPQPSRSLFAHDPAIKSEALWTGPVLTRASIFAERRGPLVRIRDKTGAWREMSRDLDPWDSMMTHCADTEAAPELLDLRERMRDWRFYDQWRTDREAPVRRPQVGTFTPVLASDGSDLAAAIQTIFEIGEAERLNEAIGDAFAGARLEISTSGAYFEVQLRQHGLLRPLSAAELSDGTLQFLQLAAALLSPRPPALMVLNEPEASLHPDLLPALARLIGKASERTQIIVVSHAPALVGAIASEVWCETQTIGLHKELGETNLHDHRPPAWNWPER